MQYSSTEESAIEVAKGLSDFFQDRVDDFQIFNIEDEPFKTFSIRFQAYKYFILLLNYDRGAFGCSVMYGDYGIVLENSQEWFDNANLNVFCKELKEQIELRIPDKFLKANGWK